MLDIVEFKAEHLRDIWPHATEDMIRVAFLYEVYGIGYSGLYEGKPIGAAGVATLLPGIGDAWAFLSDEIKAMPFVLHRRVSRELPRIIREYGLRRVQACCDPSDPRAVEWLFRLGFRYEATLAKYRDDGAPAMLFVRLN